MSSHITVITTTDGQNDTHVTPTAVQLLEAAGWKKPRRKPPAAGCSVNGCDTKATSRGMCHKHYQRFMRNGTTDPVRRPGQKVGDNAGRGCSVDGCDRPHNAKGYCVTHYQRMLRATAKSKTTAAVPKTAAVSVDITKPKTGGWVPKSGCLVEGCDGEHKARGYCTLHYQRLIKTGDPLTEPVKGLTRGQRSTATSPDFEIQQGKSWFTGYVADRRRRGIHPEGIPLEMSGAVR